MKTIVGVSQFFHQNEPKLAALIGNLALILAFIAGIPALLAEEGITTLPPLVLTIAHWATIGGLIVKVGSKLFGTVDSSGQPVNTTLPAAPKA